MSDQNRPPPGLPPRLRYPLLTSAISLSLASLFSSPTSANTINVIGACTLAEAITAANTDTLTTNCPTGAGADTIVLQNSSVHSYTTGVFAGDGDNNALPSISTLITIQGNGATIKRTSGSSDFRLLHVAVPGDLTLDNVALSGGIASLSSYGGRGGAIFNRGSTTLSNNSIVSGNSAKWGGGLYNRYSSLTLSNSMISGNSAIQWGGGLYNRSSTIMLSNSTVSDNYAGATGGGMYNSSGSIVLNNSTVSGNSADSHGGGIYMNGGAVTLKNSTLSGNYASSNGGGLYNYANSATLINSTVSGNTADTRGGGLSNGTSDVMLINSTVSGNTASTAGNGMFNRLINTITLSNSIVDNSSGGNDCLFDGGGTTFSDVTSNWFSDTSCTGTATLGNLNLGPLDNNGGPTKTHALLAGSDAIDAGNNTVCADLPVNNLDQRGTIRPQGGTCDIGAYEKVSSGFFVIPVKKGKMVIIGL